MAKKELFGFIQWLAILKTQGIQLYNLINDGLIL
jgi:hypothetical protein